ncbi:unnamed protein product [Moneuplotes crassus]|uniref:ACB domain-containing protein n=1 Tax=Euplotes crassus TaxID=5936 RepID=A0AAD2D3Y8_EUPCR|nr:unnamed protein product [Moneuplotes crassus]|eukprot:CAMPEP_0197012010 /NCGR_PEP_ID=MMETSP1380-20130617/60897_1 /TAXON_ID=5936 /ORGANISM="Euplotes crassus, Strain CT5" /LENGTH=98 /DNA_ID=CAMNT_0042435181 /DNA_START=14 /DNA_END=310 /DNA_ORIENTATION=-
MEDIDSKFDKAAQAVRDNEDKARAAKQEDMLDIYGCFKVASVGKCDTSRPGGLFNQKEKAKWDAWDKWSKMEEFADDQTKAKEKYCELVAAIVPESDW